MLPLLDHFSPSTVKPIGNGAIFLTDTMDDDQIEETKIFLKKSSWNHIMASSEASFNAVSDCLIEKQDEPWSLHLNFPLHPDDNNNNDNNNDNNDNLQCLKHLNLESIQLDLSPLNPLWIEAFNNLNYNILLKNSLKKLQLPRYLFTQEIVRKNNNGICNVFINFMNDNNNKNNKQKQKQKLLLLDTISIEMDEDLLPNQQQFANDFVFINSLNFKHPIYQSLNIYIIDRLRIFQCPFDIFMIIIHGLFVNQFSFLQNRAKKHHTKDGIDELFLLQTLRYSLNIEKLTIYPPVLKKEMLLFVHGLQYKNSPKLTHLEFQNWSIGQIASFCKGIQRLTSIQYENKQKQHKKSNHRHKRSKSHNKSMDMDIDRIIADIQGTDFKLNILKQRALFHHIHSFRLNVASSSLFAALWEMSKKDKIKDIGSSKNDKKKQIKKLYWNWNECDDNSKNDNIDNIDNKTNENTENVVHKKSLKPLLTMGYILRYQFKHLYEFGFNNYSFLFSSKYFMIQLLNGIALHPYLRHIELQGIGTETYHAITSNDLSQVITKSREIAIENYKFIDLCLEKVLSTKDIRIEIMKYLYGDLYYNVGTGILTLDFSSDKVSNRRHSIFSALQTIKRRNDNDIIDTKLDNFDKVLQSLEKNWILSGLNNNNSNQYWEWKKNTKKLKNTRKSLNFCGM